MNDLIDAAGWLAIIEKAIHRYKIYTFALNITYKHIKIIVFYMYDYLYVTFMIISRATCFNRSKNMSPNQTSCMVISSFSILNN